MPGRALLVGGRIAAGLVGAGASVLLVAAAALVPLPAAQSGVRATDVVPMPPPQQQACAGPLLRLGDANGNGANVVSSYGRADASYGVPSGAPAAATPLSTAIAAADAGAVPQRLSAPAATAPGGALAGSQSQTASTTDAAGFAASACAEPASDSWLVGGATNVGRTSLLLLSNPTAVAATVALKIYGEKGPVTGPGLSGIRVEAGAQRVVDLAGVAPGLGSPVIHVQAVGGQVVATVQQSILRGLETGGVETVGPAALPATLLTVPGVRITTTKLVAERGALPGFADLGTALRVYPVGGQVASLIIGARSDNPAVPATSLKLDVPGGAVTDIRLPDLGDGTYTITVSSTVPVVAAVRASTAAPPPPKKWRPWTPNPPPPPTERVDLAWFPAAPALTDATSLAVAQGPAPRLTLANPARAAVTATLATGGNSRTVEVPAEGSATVDVSAGSVYLLTGAAGLTAAVSYAGDGELAAYTVHPAAPPAPPVRVYP